MQQRHASSHGAAWSRTRQHGGSAEPAAWHREGEEAVYPARGQPWRRITRRTSLLRVKPPRPPFDARAGPRKMETVLEPGGGRVEWRGLSKARGGPPPGAALLPPGAARSHTTRSTPPPGALPPGAWTPETPVARSPASRSPRRPEPSPSRAPPPKATPPGARRMAPRGEDAAYPAHRQPRRRITKRTSLLCVKLPRPPFEAHAGPRKMEMVLEPGGGRWEGEGRVLEKARGGPPARAAPRRSEPTPPGAPHRSDPSRLEHLPPRAPPPGALTARSPHLPESRRTELCRPEHLRREHRRPEPSPSGAPAARSPQPYEEGRGRRRRRRRPMVFGGRIWRGEERWALERWPLGGGHRCGGSSAKGEG
ncbi:hypothetical protein GUJ93_ZPchr0006g44099 [Zizania palustris]|uniref:Uncharacterized protein n=1 Tax=Zizania palustris TaxID=103762 RepID=A0A8J5SZ97_ZIZPA|nr:hypothetical protein GUJ93_ZPchr0006g44099 [Zizania palustris]